MLRSIGKQSAEAVTFPGPPRTSSRTLTEPAMFKYKAVTYYVWCVTVSLWERSSQVEKTLFAKHFEIDFHLDSVGKRQNSAALCMFFNVNHK